MYTYSNAFYHIITSLQPLYDKHEATAIAHEVMFYLLGLSKLERLDKKDMLLTIDQEEQFNTILTRLVAGMPLQYATGTAPFFGKEYTVNKHVLIPRPETEELVQWIIDDWHIKPACNIIDIGTGSGCIPISLQLHIKNARTTSVDISVEALKVAGKNMATLNARVQLLQLDFLDRNSWSQLDRYDVIVSNPPYIPVGELSNIAPNVKEYEPHIALFVPDEDPLLFYRAIAAFGREHLTPDGAVYCELHTTHAVPAKELFEQARYKEVAIKYDMHGNLRMLKAIL